MDQGPRSNFEIGGGEMGEGEENHYWLNNGGGGEHKIPFLTESL